jgi:hypothetical protein
VDSAIGTDPCVRVKHGIRKNDGSSSNGAVIHYDRTRMDHSRRINGRLIAVFHVKQFINYEDQTVFWIFMNDAAPSGYGCGTQQNPCVAGV